VGPAVHRTLLPGQHRVGHYYLRGRLSLVISSFSVIKFISPLPGQIPLDPATMTLLAADSPSSSPSSLTDGDDGKAAQRALLHAQLALACRHVSRVFEVQASSLQSALSCTVFVNTSALSGEGGDGDGQAALFEDIRRLVLRLLQTNCNGTGCVSEKVNGERESDAGSDDDQSEDEEEEEEEVAI
jgi:hypothetical protein